MSILFNVTQRKCIMARKAFKVRLYPNKVQAIYFSKAIGCCRAVYNMMLHDEIASYEEYKKSIEGVSDDEKKNKKYKQHISYAPYTKQENTSYLKEVEARALNSVQQNLKKAFTNFFKGGGFPVYKKKTNLGSFQSDDIKVVGNKLKIPKCPGLVQYKNYEDVDFSKMTTKTITISRNVAGKFFASILCDVPDDEPLPKTGNKVGIDLGVSTAVAARLTVCPLIQTRRFLLDIETVMTARLMKLENNLHFTNKNWPRQVYGLLLHSQEKTVNSIQRENLFRKQETIFVCRRRFPH